MAIYERRMSVEDKSSRFYVLFLSPDPQYSLPKPTVHVCFIVSYSNRGLHKLQGHNHGFPDRTRREHIVCPTPNFIMIPSVRKNVGTGDRGSDSGVQVEEVFEALLPPLLVVYSTLNFAVLQNLSVLRSSSGLRFPRIVQILSHT